MSAHISNIFAYRLIDLFNVSLVMHHRNNEIYSWLQAFLSVPFRGIQDEKHKCNAIIMHNIACTFKICVSYTYCQSVHHQ